MIESFIPQRFPILLLKEIVSYELGRIVCTVDWPPSKFFHDNAGCFLVSAMPEIVAQAAAAMQGKQRIMEGGRPGIGMLSAIKCFEFYGTPQGDCPLEVIVKSQAILGAHEIVQGQIYQEQKLLAQGEVFLFLTKTSAMIV